MQLIKTSLRRRLADTTFCLLFFSFYLFYLHKALVETSWGKVPANEHDSEPIAIKRLRDRVCRLYFLTEKESPFLPSDFLFPENYAFQRNFDSSDEDGAELQT